jgi:hypothetical protein
MDIRCYLDTTPCKPRLGGCNAATNNHWYPSGFNSVLPLSYQHCQSSAIDVFRLPVGPFELLDRPKPTITVSRHQLPDRSKVFEIQCGHAVYSISSCFTKRVFGGGEGGAVGQWDIDDGHQVSSAFQAGPGSAIWASALSRDHKWLVCGLRSHPYISVWDVGTHTKHGLFLPVAVLARKRS